MDYENREIILSVRDLVISFTLRGSILTAIRGISLDLYKGESLAIVGESGSGKTVFTKSFMGLLDINGKIDSGEIIYKGIDIAKYRTEKEWLTIRGKEISMVFQDPMTSLNPLKTVGKQIQEAVMLHQKLDSRKSKDRTIEILRDVGIDNPESRFSQYPHQFSGGMRQRVVIAISIACNSNILVCDEPTTALDVTVQAQILELVRELQRKYSLTIIYITHDLGVVANVADRVVVMYAGDIIEAGLSREVFYTPRHPYTWALLSSLPQLGKKGEPLYSIKGTPPNLFAKITGDAFAPRNPQPLEIDFMERPPYFEISKTHKARTWLLDERAPKAEMPDIIAKMNSIQEVGTIDDVNYSSKDILLDVKNLTVVFGSRKKKFIAVNNVSFSIYKGETFGLVGESGSGKTTIGRAIVRINEPSEGEILYRGRKISGKISKQLDNEVIRKIQMVFQDPMASLNERAKVDYIVSEGLYNLKSHKNTSDRKERVEKALMEVGLLPEFASRFPHEFSGGQRQRIGIARILVMEPDLIIADEPISALDVSIRAQVLNLLSDLKKDKGLTYMFIAHDLSVVRFITDRVAVIHKGRIVELAETEKIFAYPMHPYTRALLSAIPQPNPDYEQSKKIVAYDPSKHNYSNEPPSWNEIYTGHFVLCNEREKDEYLKERSLITH
ncbi:MAG: ABC transporter ATP-binding protein [Treponema sp.]|nr:ABC transporter ATP-binding protein [Treponema sp.]